MNTQRRSPTAFTLMEMMVVISIIVILILIAVPAFSAMIANNNQIQAIESLKAGLLVGRDAARRGGPGQDGAAVFYFQPGGTMTIVPCVKIGTLDDLTYANTGNAEPVRRDVFVPLEGVQPVSLPVGWMVRAYVNPYTIDPTNGEWYRGARYGQSTQLGDWVFPETGFYKVNYQDSTQLGNNDDGYDRSTFMIRFEGGTGRLATDSREPAIVLSPRPSDSGRDGSTSLWSRYRIDRADRLSRFYARVTADATLSPADKRKLFGTSSASVRSSDTVLARPVNQLALYDESKLAGAMGVRVDRTTNSIYTLNPEAYYSTSGNPGPQFVNGVAARAIARWVEGYRDPLGNSADRAESPQARLFAIDRFLGNMLEMPQSLPEVVQ